MPNKILVTNFSVERGSDRFAIAYSSPRTGKTWITLTNDLNMVNIAKNPNATQEALNELKRFVKDNCSFIIL